MSDDFDFREIVRYLTAGNLFKYISVILYAVGGIIVLSWLAGFLWGL